MRPWLRDTTDAAEIWEPYLGERWDRQTLAFCLATLQRQGVSTVDVYTTFQRPGGEDVYEEAMAELEGMQ